MNVRWRSKMPWVLAFSYSRAIQQPALDIWKGEETNMAAAQKALYHRAQCNSMARGGSIARRWRNLDHGHLFSIFFDMGKPPPARPAAIAAPLIRT